MLWARGRAVIPCRCRTDSPPKTISTPRTCSPAKKLSSPQAATAKRTTIFVRRVSLQLSRYEIKAGWEIPAVLEQSLNSDLPGELKALVTSNVYDTASGLYLLIPQGSRLIGKYDSRIAYGQDGVQVAWSRIIYPDASSVDLDGMMGLDSHGNAGLRDQVDRHYRRIVGFSVLTSMFTAAFQISQRSSQSASRSRRQLRLLETLSARNSAKPALR